jgi:hypothetical protein
MNNYDCDACRRLTLAVIHSAARGLRRGAQAQRRYAEAYFRGENYRADLAALGLPYRLPAELEATE